MTYLFEKATNGYFWKSSAQHLWSLEDILARLNVGGYPEANTLRPIVFTWGKTHYKDSYIVE